MRAVVFEAAGRAATTTVPDAAIANPHEVIVQVDATAICGSDLHPYRGEWGDPAGQRPGHEFIGTVVEVGTDVVRNQVGDRVIVSGSIGCGRCPSCAIDLHASCHAGFVVMGIPSMSAYPGGQAEAVVVPNADTTTRAVPQAMSDEQALLLTDNLATGWQGVERARVREGDTVLVAGFGPVGMCAAMSAVAQGAWQVIVTDPVASRRAFAERLGYAAVDPGVDDAASAVVALAGGAGVDAAIEAAGRSAAVELCLAAAHPSAIVSAISVPSEPYPDDLFASMAPTQRYRTTVASPQRAWGPLLANLDGAAFAGVDEIFSHSMPLDDAAQAYELFANDVDNCRKVQLRP